MYKVISVTPSLLQIEITDVDGYHSQDAGKKLSIGSYLKISDDKDLTIVAVAQSFRVRDSVVGDPEAPNAGPVFVIEAQQVGCFQNGVFKRGGQQIAIPPSHVEVASEDDLRLIYDGVPEVKKLAIGALAQNTNIRVALNGDRFFGKHIGIVGSTGSGKSCAVAKVLQEGIQASEPQSSSGILNNSHIIIFDLHGEYGTAFPGARQLAIDNLVLPYWLMNSEELEEMFIESQEQNSHNQVSQFKHAVIENKRRHNPQLTKVTYDTPVYFSIDEVRRYICNQNFATKDAKTGILAVKDSPEGIDPRYLLFENVTFEDKVTSKINGGPYAGEFDRFLSRLDTKMNDERLRFLLQPRKSDGAEFTSADLAGILQQFTGYTTGRYANVTVIDLSGIPFEVVSVVVSLITRLVFDFCLHFRRRNQSEQDLPFLLVFEEAHNYIPQSEGAKFTSVKKSIERIAKEGRKYGISLMIVSQRPSEISETIFSQCNNFVAMRLTNPTDQHYMRRLLPDSVSAITEALPSLECQEAIVMGNSIVVPSIIKVDDIQHRPSSHDINFQTEWKKDWLDVQFDQIVRSMKKEAVDTCDPES